MQFEIEISKLRKFEQTIKRLNKKASKLNCNQIVFSISEEINKQKIPVLVADDHNVIQIDGMPNHTILLTRTVTIDGDSIAIKDWNFVCRIESTDAGNIFIKSSEDIEIPEKYRSFGDACEHCKKNIRRKYLYLLQNEETKEYKQVGKSCIIDFIGHPDAGELANFFTARTELIRSAFSDDDCCDQEYRGWRDDTILSADDALVAIVNSTRIYGYQKSSSETSTSSDVIYMFSVPQKESDIEDLKERWSKVIEQDHKRAKEVKEWILNIDNSKLNDYLHNLQTIIKADYVTFRNSGIFCSLAVAYNNWHGFETKNAKQKENIATKKEKEKNSVHVGEKKDRINVEGEVTFINGFDTKWGWCVVIKLLSVDGNVFTWFTSTEPDLEVGNSYVLKGTVKNHDDYKGIKQTILSRCKIMQSILKSS